MGGKWSKNESERHGRVASLQWKICSPDFIDIRFLTFYKNTLLSNISKDTIESIDDLISILVVFEKERLHSRKLENEIAKILM